MPLDSANPKQFKIEPGFGVFVNGPKGKTTNLITKDSFGDLEAHVEFCVPKGSNSGVKFHSVYEIQIFDSWQSTKKPIRLRLRRHLSAGPAIAQIPSHR